MSKQININKKKNFYYANLKNKKIVLYFKIILNLTR